MTSSALSVKWDHQGAFRRFVLDLPANGDLYGALIAKILAVQPGFNDSLAWKDNEGDLIVFTSTAELIEAVNALKTGEPLRLYTVVNGDKDSKAINVNNAAPVPPAPVPEPRSVPIPIQPAPPMEAEPVKEAKTVDESQEAVHVNISCDGCNQSPLKGIRHKCLVCMDFDLCEKCKTEDKHAGHPMTRIADPSDRSWMRHFARRRMGPPPPPPFWFRHVPQHVWEQMKQQQQQQQKKQENHACQCECKPSNGEQAKQAPEQQPNAASVPPAAEFDRQKFLHDIGSSVAQLLDSFGIDVDVHVEEGKKDKTTEEAKATPTTGEGQDKAAPSAPAKEEVDLEKLMAQLMTALTQCSTPFNSSKSNKLRICDLVELVY